MVIIKVVQLVRRPFTLRRWLARGINYNERLETPPNFSEVNLPVGLR